MLLSIFKQSETLIAASLPQLKHAFCLVTGLFPDADMNRTKLLPYGYRCLASMVFFFNLKQKERGIH